MNTKGRPRRRLGYSKLTLDRLVAEIGATTVHDAMHGATRRVWLNKIDVAIRMASEMYYHRIADRLRALRGASYNAKS